MGMNALEVRRRVMLAQPHEAEAVGAVASFVTDVVSALPMEFDLNPIQDLHGQANPYPPGGGVNIWDEQWESGYWTDDGTKANNSNRIRCKNRIPLDTGKTYYINASTNNYELYMIFFNSSEAYLRKQLIRNTTFVPPENTAYGLFYVVGISTYSNDISINYPSTDHNYHPYSNLCPITGHDGFTRIRTGKNLLPQTNYNTQYFTVASDGSVTQNNPSSAPFSWAYSQSIMRVTLPPGKYTITETLTTAVTDSSHTVRTIDDKENMRTIVNGTKDVGTYSGTFTLTKWTNLGVAVKLYNGVAKFSITPGEAAQPYEPFGHSYTTTFPTPPGTVYGGHVRDNGDGTGTLVVDTAIISTTWGDIGNATEYTDNIRKRMTLSVADNKDKRGDAVCNVAPTATTGIGYDRVQMVIHESNSYVYITLPKNTASDTPVQIVYYIATPQTYTLSLDAIQSLIGQNNVWVDNADSVSVEYWGH